MQKKYLNILLILALALISVGNSFFLHAHKTASGEIVIHSHFHSNPSDANGADHSHSNEEIKQIYLFSAFTALLVIFTALFAFALKNISKLTKHKLSFYKSQHFLNFFSLRAPPQAA
ncbi:MAG: hypothetical protein ACEPO8_11950 [Rhodothermaceae bacterium]